MPINNITQTISELPAAGRRGVDVQTQFVIKQEDFQDHLQGTTVTELNTLKDQLNTRIGEINSTVTAMNGYATSASSSASTATTKAGEAATSASTATTKAGEAATSASAALTSKNQANTFATNSSNSATKASQWADNNYNVAVETGKYSAKHWSTVAQNASINKVDKVTSIDNAIVRFDGITGVVQNSNVIIDDGGNITTQGLRSTSPIYGLGYGAGSGGTVTQLTSKSTAVILNKPSGQIIMNNAALAAGSSVIFTLNNSLLSELDILCLTMKWVSSINYHIEQAAVGATTSLIRVTNISSLSLSEALQINFAIIKGANS